jgi:hypothetical protein
MPAAGGTRTVEVAPADLPQFLRNNRAWIAKMCGITVADLDAYDVHEGMQRCGATTKAGRRCRKSLAPDSSPAEFVQLHAGRCGHHS